MLRIFSFIFGSKLCEIFDSQSDSKVVIFIDCQLIGKFQRCKQKQKTTTTRELEEEEKVIINIKNRFVALPDIR